MSAAGTVCYSTQSVALPTLTPLRFVQMIKPIYGFLSDAVPIYGYRRCSYLAICGLLGGCQEAGRAALACCGCLWLAVDYGWARWILYAGRCCLCTTAARLLPPADH